MDTILIMIFSEALQCILLRDISDTWMLQWLRILRLYVKPHYMYQPRDDINAVGSRYAMPQICIV